MEHFTATNRGGNSQSSTGYVFDADYLTDAAGDVLRGAPQNRLQVALLQTGILQQLVQRQTYGWALTASFYGARPAPSAVETSRQVLATQPLRTLIPILQAMMDGDYYPRLSDIRLPCTVMYGGQDKTSPAQHSEDLHRGLAGSRLVRIEHAGHMLNWEAPEAVAALIRSVASNTNARAE